MRKDYDSHRYLVYLASREAFQGDSRKGEKDITSNADVELLTCGLVLSRMEYKGQPVGSVNILTNDTHLSKTLCLLKTCDEFINYQTRVLLTREDIRR